MIYDVHYDVCAILISLFSIVFIISKKGFKKNQNKLLLLLMIATVFASFFDIISSIANSYVDEWSIFSRNFFNCAYLLIQNTMPFLFFIYTFCLIGLDYIRKKNIFFHALITMPYICVIVLLLLNPFFHWVFYYNENKIYSHDFAMIFLYVIALLYLLSCYFIINKYGKGVSFGKKAMVYVFLGATLCAVLIQIMLPNILLQLFIESLCFTGILFTVDNEDEITDYVTTCYNRRAFINDNTLYIKRNASYNVIVLKLPNLNYYNVTMGVTVINGFMKKIGIWLQKLNSSTNVYYCDNGNFAIICASEEKKEQMMKQIIDEFHKSWVFNGMVILFRIKLWAANIPNDIRSLEQLLLVIDTSIKGYRTIFDSEILGNKEVYGYKRELAVEQAIEKALIKKSFKVYYQPIFDTEKNIIISAEALVRLNDNELGNIPPDEFIPLAEKKGYIVEIGHYIFESVCRFFAEYKLSEIGISYIEVNLSALQCMSEGLVKSFTSIIDKYSLKNSCINLEITESALTNNIEIMEDTINRLSELGFTFSMDDYGTGYSNFTYILDMPFDIIKLDKSILWKSTENARAMTLLSNTIRMVREMNMKTVVEGVETAEQKNLLQNLGCDFQQGYYFSKPLPEEEFYKYCTNYNTSQTDENNSTN